MAASLLLACDPQPVLDAGSDAPTEDVGRLDVPSVDVPDAPSTFVLPEPPMACGPLVLGTGDALATVTGVPDVSLADAGSELALAYVDRAADGTHTLALQRVSPAGTVLGTPIPVTVLGTTVPVGAAVASDGEVFVVCGSSSVEVRCATVPVGGTSAAPGATVAGASLPALAHGAGGFALAYLSGGGISLQRLDASAALSGSPQPIASGTGRPSIAPMEVGWVVGFADATTARAQKLDATGVPAGTPLVLGAARSMTQVAVTYAGGAIGAGFVAPTGDAMAFVEGHPAFVVGPGADSFGRVAAAPAANGLVVAWSDFYGFIGLVPVGRGGAALGPRSTVNVSWDDNPHALAATADGFVLATTTTPSGAPIELHTAGCP